jgi:DNA-binding Xre family transcriptional regulator
MSTLHKKRIGKVELAKAIDISNGTLAKIGRDEPVSLKIIDDICNFLECGVADVIEHVNDNSKE